MTDIPPHMDILASALTLKELKPDIVPEEMFEDIRTLEEALYRKWAWYITYTLKTRNWNSAQLTDSDKELIRKDVQEQMKNDDDPLGVFDEMAEAIVRLQDVAAIKSKTPQEEQDRDAYVRIQMETIKMCGPPLQAMFPDKADYDRRLLSAQKRFRKKMELEELRKKDD